MIHRFLDLGLYNFLFLFCILYLWKYYNFPVNYNSMMSIIHLLYNFDLQLLLMIHYNSLHHFLGLGLYKILYQLYFVYQLMHYNFTIFKYSVMSIIRLQYNFESE